MKHYLLAIICTLLFIGNAFAQQKAKSPRNANYNMDVTLDTDKKLITGQMHLNWRNITPDTIRELQFHLYLNAFKNTQSTFMKEGGGRYGDEINSTDELSWGYTDIEELKIKGGEDLTAKIEYIQPDDDNVEDQTVIRIPLKDSILPGDTVDIMCKFKSKLPKIFSRTGFAKNYFFVGQWFPKIGVYEPAGMRYATKGGWNCHQFHAKSEFYADFGNYNVCITLPKGYKVGATGLMTTKKVNGNEQKLRFIAEDVVDFAWTASQDYIDLREQWEGTEIRLLLQPEHKGQADRHFESIKAAISYMNKYVGKYPYPNITIVDPPYYGMSSYGMEYPTLFTTWSQAWMPENYRYSEIVTVHEYIHQYFMGILATNEFEEAWMDEGMTSYYESRIMDATYGKGTSFVDFGGYSMGITEALRTDYAHSEYNNIAESYRNSWEYPILSAYGTLTYDKPATFLNTLHRMVGDSCMDDIMKTYYKKWKFKHPSSKDFIAVVNEVVAKHHKNKFGENMNWYFDQVLYGSEICDYTISEIINEENPQAMGIVDANDKNSEEKKYNAKVILKREGQVTMPVEVLIRFASGQEITKTWNGRERSFEMKFATNSKIVMAQIDPEYKILMDVNLANNSKELKADTNPVWKYTVRFLFWLQNIIQSVVWFA